MVREWPLEGFLEELIAEFQSSTGWALRQMEGGGYRLGWGVTLGRRIAWQSSWGVVAAQRVGAGEERERRWL